ncbi:MAG: ABC transporter ATP-binding protein [Candidatus Heimdallarchaeota archaeon]|nr:MAG: ABC transporter ATP-binding protein [Candidatus Heimdallarchaeota archaeon]
MSNIIEVRNLKKYFGKGEKLVKAVDGISLDIRENEIFGFLGPNGAGKTTSLRMIIGLLKPDAGNITIMGQNPHDNGKELNRMLGIIPQSLTFYEDLTVEENLWFLAKIYDIPKKEAKARIDSLISKVGLNEKRGHLARDLSGGLKRRLNLILGLVHDPKIILCDEPTPGLDPQSRVAVWEVIKDLPNQGKTIILTTHFMEEADRLSDRVAIIDRGRILVLDTPKRLKSSIGEGDLVEISLKEKENLDHLVQDLRTFEGIEDAYTSSGYIVIRALDVVSRLSRILNFIESHDQEVENMAIRSTSLEDVFINLTGRALRD